MSGHGKRETTLRANATRWRDRVSADMATATGCAALSEHRLSIQFVNDVVDAIAGCIAAGDGGTAAGLTCSPPLAAVDVGD